MAPLLPRKAYVQRQGHWRMQPLSGRQEAQGGEADCFWWPGHQRDLLAETYAMTLFSSTS
jgi:hypothetical protein